MKHPLLALAWIPVVLAFAVGSPFILVAAVLMAICPSLSRKDTP